MPMESEGTRWTGCLRKTQWNCVENAHEEFGLESDNSMGNWLNMVGKWPLILRHSKVSRTQISDAAGQVVLHQYILTLQVTMCNTGLTCNGNHTPNKLYMQTTT